MPKIETENYGIPKAIQPYLFHGLALDGRSGDQCYGDCPWCGREDKFYVSSIDSRWFCQGCQEGSGVTRFLEMLWEKSNERSVDYTELTENRGLLHESTLSRWGVCRSLITDDWIIPAHGADRKLKQIYRYTDGPNGKKILMATTGRDHALFGIPLWQSRKPIVYVAEGPWDGMVLWETVSRSEYAKEVNVIAVPGCNAFLEYWLDLFSDKEVYLLYDNDHPRKHPKSGKLLPPHGYQGMRRAAGMLMSANEPPSGIHILQWGEEDHNPELKPGYDVRDALTEGSSLGKRVEILEAILSRVIPVPDDWAIAREISPRKMQPLDCSSWKSLTDAWRQAIRWRQEMDDVFSVMLAVALSTEQQGDSQLFLQVIGSAGSGKTKLCDAMLVSKKCYPIEHVTGFHSGWKDDSGKDFSLLSRINKKTLITSEADVITSGPRFQEIMSQQRRIFDGSSRASFKNRKEDMNYTGLRTPWIMAGTQALLSTDQSRLGDRFLKIYLTLPDEDEKKNILDYSGNSAIDSVLQSSNGAEETTMSERMSAAYRMTGGYIDYLRAEAQGLLQGLDLSNRDEIVDNCRTMAEMVADLRARPEPGYHRRDYDKESEATKELPTRLTHQLVRLAICLACVLNRSQVDHEVLRRVRKVATDTCRGRTFIIADGLYRAVERGIGRPTIAYWTHQTEDNLEPLLQFMRQLEILKINRIKRGNVYYTYWQLTNRFREIFKKVVDVEDTVEQLS